jgi:RHS repeat-associated protein
MWVVATHAVDNGETTARSWSYRYGDGRSDLQLGTWVGFSFRAITDNLSGAVTRVMSDNRTRIGTLYPYARLPTMTVVEARSERDPTRAVVRIRTTVHTYALVTPAPGTLFVYEAAADERETERKPAGTAVEIRRFVRSEIHDTFDNVTTRDVQAFPIVSGAPGVTPSRTVFVATYDNFAPPWIIGLTRSISVTSITPDSRTATRLIEHDYTPDTAQLWKTRIEPGSQYASDIETSSLFSVTTYERDGYGLIATVRREGSDETRVDSFTYDPTEHMILIERRNALAQRWTTVAYDRPLALATLIRDPNGVDVSFEYDGFGRLRALKPQGAAQTSIRYDNDPMGRYRVTIDTQGSGATELLHDRLGRETDRFWTGAGGRRALVQTGYDALGRKARVSLPRWVGDPYRFEVFTYDDMDRLVQLEHPDFSFVKVTYDGLTTIRQDEKGNITSIVEDELARPIASTRFGDKGGPLTTRLFYGPFGLTRRVVDPGGNASEMEYDRLGRRTRVVDPHTGTATFRYNAFGELTNVIDGAAHTSTTVRDLLGRPKSVETSDGTATFTWDTAAHGVGRLATMTSQQGISTTYGFDEFSRPVQVAWTIEGEPFAVDVTYDVVGRLENVEYPATPGSPRFVLKRAYTPTGFLENVTRVGGDLVWAVDERDAAGRIVRERFANGVSTVRTFDTDRGWLRTVKTSATAGGTPSIQNLEFEWERNGNLFRRYERNGSWAEEFHYDSLDRLVGWDAYNLAWNTRVPAIYTYDDLGNMRSRTIPDQPPGQETVTYGYGENGAGPTAPTSIAGGTPWSYDRVGNRSVDSRLSIEYTASNLPRLIQSGNESTSFAYDGTGERVLKTGPRDTVVSVGGLYERRVSQGIAAHIFLVPGEGRIVAQYATGDRGTTFHGVYLHDDHLGSIESVTDQQAGWMERRAYDPFGTRQNPDNRGRPLTLRPATSIALDFASHRYDADLDLIDMKGRVYEPRGAHFLSADSVVSDPTDGRMWNRYAYVLNNPTTLTDPTGLQAQSKSTELSESQKAMGFYLDAAAHTLQPAGELGIGLDLTKGEVQSPPTTVTGGGSDSTGSAKPAASADDSVSGQTATPTQLAQAATPQDTGTASHESGPVLDVFVFGALSADTPPVPSPSGSAMIVNEFEAVAVAGYSSEQGPYVGDIFANGLKVGGESTYAAVFGGKETTRSWGIPEKGVPPKTDVENIILVEGSIGVKGTPIGVFAGSFQTGPDHSGKTETGLYFGVGNKAAFGDHGFVGFGFAVPDLKGLFRSMKDVQFPVMTPPMLPF